MKIHSKCLLVFALLGAAIRSEAAFTPSTICVDTTGKIIPCPAYGESFYVADTVKSNLTSTSQTSTGLSKSTSGSSYSSHYSSSAFKVKEEAITNYNQIGSRVGTHWVAYNAKRSYRSLTTTKPVKKAVITLSLLGFPVTAYKLVTVTSTIQVVDKISFQQGTRAIITDINVYNPTSAEEGYERLPTLSNKPEMRSIINIHNAADPYESKTCLASAYVIMGKGDNDPWNKPVIVADGFDPRNRIGIQEVLENVPNSIAPSAYSFMQSVLDQGHDIIFVDFREGAGDIVNNARVMLRVIETVCAKSNGYVTVSGYSMGGLIARIALLLGEKNSVPGMWRVNKFLSIDSPHLGSQMNYDMQKKLLSIANNPLDNMTNIIAYEMIASAAYDLKSKAAKQMLFTHYESSEHSTFYQFIKNIGNYPSSAIQKYSVGGAAWKWPYPNASLTGQKAATMTSTTLYVKEEDLHPGSYIDIWAADPKQGLLSSPVIKEYLGLTTEKPIAPTFGDTRYKPTHMPLYTVFGIEKSTFVNIKAPANQDELDNIARLYTPFNHIYLVDFNVRPKHIEFDNLMTVKVLKVITRPNISAITNMILN